VCLACERTRAREAFVIDHSTLLVVINGTFGTPLGDLGLLLRRLTRFVPLLAFRSAFFAFLRLDLRNGLVMYGERETD